MAFYLDEPVFDDWIMESAIATPYSVEENIKRGNMAMQHVISTHGKEYNAMYRKDLGWIAFSWGETGTPPPDFKNREEAIQWWANLPGKTNAQKGSHVFSKGRGISHIIAKRDWEAKWMMPFAGQNGVDVAMKCVEVLAKGIISRQETRKNITYGNIRVNLVPDRAWSESKELRAQGKKKEEYWILTGFEVVDDEEYGIFESAVVTGGGNLPTCPTQTMPLVPRHSLGAADPLQKNLAIDSHEVNLGWLYDL